MFQLFCDKSLAYKFARFWALPSLALEQDIRKDDQAVLMKYGGLNAAHDKLLEDARTLADGNPLVFPMRSGRPIAASTLPKMLRQHGIAAVAHGFRSSFRDWAAEETDHPREVIEAALAHVVQNKVKAAYARSDLFERRRRLMAD